MFSPKRTLWTLAAPLIICTIGCSDDDPADSWQRLGGTEAPIYALQEYKGRLLFGGEFQVVDAFGAEEQVNHLAAYADPSQQDTHSDIWQDIPQVSDAAGTWYDLSPEPNGTVHAMTIFQGDLIVAGTFTYIGPIRASGIARWDGRDWHSLGEAADGWGITGFVYALATDGTSTLYAAGSFTQAGNHPANRIAEWDGATWHPLAAGLNNTAYALHERADQLFAGGAFTEAGGQPANHIARWNGSAWLPLDVGVDGTVRALATYRGALIAGGDFITVNGFEMNHVARWIGVNWLPMAGGLGDVESVPSLALINDEIYAGGTISENQAGKGTSSINNWNGSIWGSLPDAGPGTCQVIRTYQSRPIITIINDTGATLYRANN